MQFQNRTLQADIWKSSLLGVRCPYNSSDHCIWKSFKILGCHYWQWGKLSSFICVFFPFFPPSSLQMSGGLWTQCVTSLNETQQKAIQDLLKTAWAPNPVVFPLCRNTHHPPLPPIKTSWTFGSLPFDTWAPASTPPPSPYCPTPSLFNLTEEQVAHDWWEDIETPTTNYFFSPP